MYANFKTTAPPKTTAKIDIELLKKNELLQQTIAKHNSALTQLNEENKKMVVQRVQELLSNELDRAMFQEYLHALMLQTDAHVSQLMNQHQTKAEQTMAQFAANADAHVTQLMNQHQTKAEQTMTHFAANADAHVTQLMNQHQTNAEQTMTHFAANADAHVSQLMNQHARAVEYTFTHMANKLDTHMNQLLEKHVVSPFETMKRDLKPFIESQLKDELREEIRLNIYKQIDNEIKDIRTHKEKELLVELRSKVIADLKHEMKASVEQTLMTELTPTVTSKLKQTMTDTVEKELRNELRPYVEHNLRREMISSMEKTTKQEGSQMSGTKTTHNDFDIPIADVSKRGQPSKHDTPKNEPKTINTNILKNLITHKLVNN